ncbi:MAG: helix-turn-helix transcriptional regulator [Burkholderiaceae bacterium]|nr:helix-turn-helix transcriptional regulator [Roseateles sp.]MBV8469815.1 helix-turn-helix transcriptional regulator [Burkholderiaceae bacterium]
MKTTHPCVQELIILSRDEEERLVRAIENGLYVRLLRQLFTWSQGALGALLPHSLMVCVHLDEDDRVLHTECLNAQPRDADALHRLYDSENGLAVNIVRHCRQFGRLTFRGVAELADDAASAQKSADLGRPAHSESAAQLSRSIGKERLSNVLACGTERLQGGATFFALFDIPTPPTERHEYFLTLLLPYMHQAFLRIIATRDATGQGHIQKPASPLSSRELEVMRYLLLGKTNVEIGMILAVSALTVKNHLQKIYRKLNVGNRVQAIARAHALNLLPMPANARTGNAPSTAVRGH